MEAIEHPEKGQIWVKDNLRREIVDVEGFPSRHINDFNVIWRRPGTRRLFQVYLPYWKTWEDSAELELKNND